MSNIQGKAAAVQDAIHDQPRQILPVARKLAGYDGAYLIVDRNNGKFLRVILWDSEKDRNNKI